MTARTIRRAMERKAQKQARKEARSTAAAAAPGSLFTPTTAEITAEKDALLAKIESHKATLAQLQANRRNALLSTGPTSPEGKATSSRNALKTGLTGKTVLLANEDAALYEHHVQSFFQELKPIDDREIELTQSIADSKWRLARIPSLEFGIYALGRMQFAEEFQNLPSAEAAALIEAKTFLAHQKQFNHLSIQESRLRRQCEKDTAELKRLQELRAAETRKTNAKAAPASKPQPRHEEIGFDFSNPAIDAHETGLDLPFDHLTHTQAA